MWHLCVKRGAIYYTLGIYLVPDISIFLLKIVKMSLSTIKPTKWHVRPAKTQIRLGIHRDWSVLVKCFVGYSGPKLSSCGQWRLLIRLVECLDWSVFAGRTVILLVLSCCDSFSLFKSSIHIQCRKMLRLKCYIFQTLLLKNSDWFSQ